MNLDKNWTIEMEYGKDSGKKLSSPSPKSGPLRPKPKPKLKPNWDWGDTVIT